MSDSICFFLFAIDKGNSCLIALCIAATADRIEFQVVQKPVPGCTQLAYLRSLKGRCPIYRDL